METSVKRLSQKEYLKKYLSNEKSEKKKKKKKISSSSHIKRSVIIDDDLGLPSMASIDDEEFNLEYLGDEAPQVAGIVDERPLEIRAKESHGDRNKWKPVTEPEENSFINNLVNKLEVKAGIPKNTNAANDSKSYMKKPKEMRTKQDKTNSDSDVSLHEREVLRKSKKSHSSDSDFSPPRSKTKKLLKKHSSGSDTSPPRRKKRDSLITGRSNEQSSSKYEHDLKNSIENYRDRLSTDSDPLPTKRKDSEKSRNRKNIRNDSDSDLSLSRYNSQYKLASPRRIRNKNESNMNSRREHTKDCDSSPARNRSESKHEKYRKKRKDKNGDSNVSPLRTKGEHKPERSRTKESDSDLSPPRMTIKDDRGRNTERGNTSDSDSSLQRIKDNGRGRKSYRSQESPPRWKDKGNQERGRDKGTNKYSDSDSSPPRLKNKGKSEKFKNRKNNQDSDSDLSPPRMKYTSKHGIRKSKYDSDSPPSRSRNNDGYDRRSHEGKLQDSDSSPRRKLMKRNRGNDDSDLSPPRRKESFENKRRQEKHYDNDSDFSPPRRSNRERQHEIKLDKTLDGKKAGLQTAKNLKEELKILKERENAAFAKMRASVSGQNATAVMRDRKTGKIRDLEKEKRDLIEKSAKTLEREKKYAKWGKGLKQLEDAEERLADALHEMNKPLARYAGDDDLENILKAREREGDPMLDYIRNKQAEAIDVDNIGKPKYQGHFMPNRFGIRPGHRWDGVDRSNGYEKQWFERQNARKAVQEEAYKWSTSDM